jgi:hypothetical protein
MQRPERFTVFAALPLFAANAPSAKTNFTDARFAATQVSVVHISSDPTRNRKTAGGKTTAVFELLLVASLRAVYVLSLQALRASLDLELHLRTLVECSVAIHLDR